MSEVIDRIKQHLDLSNDRRQFPEANGPRFFAGVLPREVDAHYVFDIESFGRRPDLLHVGALVELETEDARVYRTWSDIVLAINELVIENKTTKIWAHYGSRFDWIGLADELGLAYGCPVVVKHKVDGKKKPVNIHYEIRVFGDRQVIAVKAKMDRADHRAELTDSSFHLEGALKNLGAKGVTPYQYKKPVAWTKRYRRLHPELVGTDFEIWFKAIRKRSVDYCVNDCIVLAKALKAYRDFGYTLTNNLVNYLDLMTAPKAGLFTSILMAPMPKTERMISFSPDSRKEKGKSDWVINDTPDVDYYDYVERPLAENKHPSTTHAGWYCNGNVAVEFTRVMHGGRVEIFAPVTKPGMRPFVIDANSMYPSVMSTMRFVDPRRLLKLKADVVGRAAILEHLEQHTGMYKVELPPSINPLLNQYPSVPIRRSGGQDLERIAFPAIDSKVTIYITGEELRYFLQFDAVVNDDVRIIAEASLAGPLLGHGHSPLSQFASRLYGLRKRARKDGDKIQDALCKILMNAGGFGPHSQMYDDMQQIILPPAGQAVTESHAALASASLINLAKLDPMWDGWKSMAPDVDGLEDWLLEVLIEKKEKETPALEYVKWAMNTAKRWGNDHWRPSPTFQMADGSTVIQTVARQYLAGHSIRPWAVQITAESRIRLHEAIIKTVSSGFDAAYCDTDSVHMMVPEGMTDDEVVAKLKAAGIKIGDELGEWKPEAYKDGSAKAIYLSPKVYSFIGNEGEVQMTKAKGLRRGGEYDEIMRASMISIGMQIGRLGNKRGLKVNYVAGRDALAREPRLIRHYPDQHHSVAMKVSEMVSGEQGSAKGMKRAKAEFMQSTYDRVPVTRWRARIQGAIEEIDTLTTFGDQDLDENDLDEIVAKHLQISSTAVSIGIDE